MATNDTGPTSSDTTFPMDIAGRTIIFKHVLKGQLMMLGKVADQTRRHLAATEDQRMSAELVNKMNVQMLEVIESRVVNPDDVVFLEQQMLLGVIDLDDLMPVLSGGVKQSEPVADDEASVVKPRKAARAAKAVRKPRKAAVKKN